MKIKPLLPIFEAKLTSKLIKKISKDFRYKIVDTKAKGEIDSIIVLGNGDVDDLTIPIVCHHLNGSKIVGITKPEGKKRCKVLSEFPKYISKLKIDKIALVMDQEKDDLDKILKKIEKDLKNLNIKFDEVNGVESDNQVKHYQCMYGSKKFDFILIISGLPNIQANTHKIEDHLVKAALKLSKISNSNLQDSKKTWNSYFDASLQKEILKKLVENISLSSEVFPQHFDGLRLLEE